jgi:dodecin
MRGAKAAVERAGESLRDLRVAEVVEQDLVIHNGQVSAYRTKVKVSVMKAGTDALLTSGTLATVAIDC